MRPNVDIPWSIHGKIKQYAQTNDITIEEAYIEALNAGTGQLAISDDTDGLSLSREKDKWPFGPWQIPSQGEESFHINYVTTCFPNLYTPDLPVRINTRRQNISKDEVESMLASLQTNTRITDDWFTIHQLGGAWVGRGLTNFAHALSTSKELFNQSDFPLYKQGSAIYIGSLPRENEVLFLRANISRRKEQISNFSLTFLLDGYPVSGHEYYKIASRLGFSELFNAQEHHLPSLYTHFKEPPKVEVVEKVTDDNSDRDGPWVSGLIIENPFQWETGWKNKLEWKDIPDENHQKDAESATETLSNYDHLYCELLNHHPMSDDKEYQLNSVSATYLSTLLPYNSIWNISLSVDW